ncbi:ricin-type beta-trefoil lectin domain protein [Kitasatospora sp. NPDC051853]|uniref:ricin-type beta-trefoil lectin domain protein n=1 Tax=Kitasatospora sp. NPDC051853 TaxID=3364058 RepID=UPI0037A41414
MRKTRTWAAGTLLTLAALTTTTPAGAIEFPDKNTAFQLKAYNGTCAQNLYSADFKHTAIVLRACDKTIAAQKWHYYPSTGQLENWNDSLCVEAPKQRQNSAIQGGPLLATTCGDNPRQKWAVDKTTRIKPKGDATLCWTADKSTRNYLRTPYVYLGPCTSKLKPQNWTIVKIM